MLNKKQKEIRDRKVVEMDIELEKKQSAIIKVTKSHQDIITQLEEGIIEETLLRDALNSLK